MYSQNFFFVGEKHRGSSREGARREGGQSRRPKPKPSTHEPKRRAIQRKKRFLTKIFENEWKLGRSPSPRQPPPREQRGREATHSPSVAPAPRAEESGDGHSLNLATRRVPPGTGDYEPSPWVASRTNRYPETGERTRPERGRRFMRSRRPRHQAYIESGQVFVFLF